MWMPNDLFPVEVRFAPQFKRDLKRLARKYRHIRKDLDPVINAISAGETPGNRISGIQGIVFKHRVRNRDARRGTRGGYRLIYYIPSPRQVILITIYSKSDQTDMSADEIARIIEETRPPDK
jgi:mRNA-degrading endonuclease RelE of RelBE toxin-antitoxin system